MLTLASQPSAAQSAIVPGALLLSGYRASCGPVDTVIQTIGDIAGSYDGHIYLDPRVFALPRAQQLFWYTHECAHQMFGASEPTADCWSVQQGRIQGWLSQEELGKLRKAMADLPGDATHFAGRVRIAYMSVCYSG